MGQLLWISLLSGLATGIGGLIVIWFGHPNSRVLGFYLGLSAGMMGMVVLIDLLPASLEYGSIKGTLVGLITGIFIMLIFDWLLSKVLFSSSSYHYRNMGYFMTLAIALHNLPEGLAIGAGFETKEEIGIRVALIIALHNIPEGLGVASSLYLGNLSNLLVVLLPLITGFFIPIGTIISNLIGEMIPNWISIGLSVASGAMGYLVIKEVGPESLRLNRLSGQFGVVVGILLMFIVYLMHN
ncbi:hypothetical protein BHF71_01330 [Vulcanibacillus modesticaldus]|uniref:Dihydroorotate dehydrogenase n=1 Tax=Vulcanibacillus modesticaldus TaxID=337097 RepID=A0A1D2YW46_9BACI|nr:ZIP family metal transporter [Vulcanibacillus modesticaldus]OEF99845.1 hypothetical protein BHF71_01330 [Vulcanibacillus modesticaldus]